jgi:hypothetical protein
MPFARFVNPYLPPPPPPVVGPDEEAPLSEKEQIDNVIEEALKKNKKATAEQLLEQGFYF